MRFPWSAFLKAETTLLACAAALAAASARADGASFPASDGAPAVGPAVAIEAGDRQGPSRPWFLGEPLDASLLIPGRQGREASRADWRRRLKASQGRPTLVPLGPPDPSLPLLVLVPGFGMNFQDAYALSGLRGDYEVFIAVTDQTRPIHRLGPDLARALDELAAWRRGLASLGGRPAPRGLRIIGHSMGGLIVQHALRDLAGRERLGPDGRGHVGRVLFLGIDAPWRGVDVPWAALAPGLKHALAELLPRLPLPKRVNRGALSTINRTQPMNLLLDVRTPGVETHFVTVLGTQDTTSRTRHFEPVANWYSKELGQGELKKLWRHLRGGGRDPNGLDGFANLGLVRKQGLQHLWRTLERDADFEGRRDQFARAARESATPEEFARRYDALVGEVVDTFHGQHTRFMWEDPAFMPWLRGFLARHDPGQAAAATPTAAGSPAAAPPIPSEKRSTGPGAGCVDQPGGPIVGWDH